MIDLLPLPADFAKCPRCHEAVLETRRFFLPGMMPLAESDCPNCRRQFIVHLDIGFGGGRNLVIDVETGRPHSVAAPPWYSDRMLQALASRNRPVPKLEVQRRRPQDEDVILIDTLDSTYGHVLQALYGCQIARERHPEAALIVIVPAFAAWLVPDYVDEIWIVHDPLRACNLWNQAVADKTAELLRTARRVRLMTIGWYHNDSIEIDAFTGILPMAGGTVAAATPARLTLVWRDDRCWTYRGRRLEQKAAIAEQQELYRLLLERIRVEIPDLDAAVIGYGSPGGFPEWISDLRVVDQDSASERAWIARCAESHLVFGMHGSNMILPAAHAAGAIEVAANALDPYITWEWVNQYSAQDALRRYRLVQPSASLSDIVSLVFIQLRRMQQGFVYRLPAPLRFQLLAQNPGIFQGAYELTVKDAAGADL